MVISHGVPLENPKPGLRCAQRLSGCSDIGGACIPVHCLDPTTEPWGSLAPEVVVQVGKLKGGEGTVQESHGRLQWNPIS